MHDCDKLLPPSCATPLSPPWTCSTTMIEMCKKCDLILHMVALVVNISFSCLLAQMWHVMNVQFMINNQQIFTKLSFFKKKLKQPEYEYFKKSKWLISTLYVSSSFLSCYWNFLMV